MELRKDLINQIKRLTNIGIALSSEKDINNFFKLVLDEAINYTSADAGTIYTVSEDKKFLDFKVICTLSMNLRLGIADTSKWPSVSLYNKDGKKRLKNFVSYVAHTGETTSIDDVYNQDIFDNSGTKKYDKANNYHSKSMAAIPLKNHENEVLGVIQLINAMDEKGEIISFTDQHLTMLTSLASQAAIALSNKKLIEGLEKLLYQFIKSIAAAIDRKSKYTGGHITRVATLCEEISKKIKADKKYFKDINFTEDELQEISISGWMHDVGKITTPIYVVDKAKKLETIFDRIEVVTTRFKLIKSLIQKDIVCCSAVDKIKKQNLEKTLKQLEEDRKFVKRVNTGGEFMQDEDLDRIERIYNFNYETEGKKYLLITENEKINLSIRRGTLLPEEFEKMREHAIVTHEMLSELTFPKKFKNVPLYASAHHEKLNGQGYPFKLTAEELPIQARIIAVADLYEALTASDRPYKKGKTLTESLRIMAFMVKDGEIDKSILNLLIDSGLYLEYAKKFLKPEQIDDVDTEKIKAMYQ
ncbi:MAG: GAF domain-containing protein [Candidatus Cloacimonetes bacterium]|nr:GAF domain-containing protein [Candidatus Cloacimonadota bacterium]